uniref:Ataxin 7 like 1 n=1 Tax=Myripristis murdjan TaxID=586833 RepID=A0A667YJX2_9TELE
MATVAERRSLPSPEIMLGQPWSNWVDAAKLHDMPIFGQCPAQDDFYLVMCSLCSQVVKPQAFQAHYGNTLQGVAPLSPYSCSPITVQSQHSILRME